MIDHLVYATPDLTLTIDEIDARCGVRASPGGQHMGRGTRNALLSLGPCSYLELIGPDPEQPMPGAPRWFGIDALTKPRLVTWAAGTSDVAGQRNRAERAGMPLGGLLYGSRQRPDGVLLEWQYSDPMPLVADGVVPFFIDWGASPHPATRAAAGLTLVAFRATHPSAAQIANALRALDVADDLAMFAAPSVALIAELEGPGGRIELR